REIDLSQIVKSLETLTTLVNNGDGTYTYTSENGTKTIVNVPQDVIDQFEKIINNETVKNKILELLTVVGGGNVYYDGTRFTYADANGVVREIDLSQIVKSLETLTTLVNNGDGTYTYTSENGTKTIVNVPQDVIDQFEKIINNETVKNKILELLTVVGGGNVYYNGTKFTYVDANGVVREIDLSQIVKSLETLTTLVNNNNGTFTYTSENGTQTIIDVPQSVINEFEKIISDETVKNKILELLTVVGGGNVYYDGSTFTYADANGVVRVIDLSQIIKSLETLTTLVNNEDGTYTYTSENGTKTIIDVPQDVIDQFEKIINNETVKNQILELITISGGGNVYYDGTKFEYLDVDGIKKIIDISAIVKANETLTTLVDNGDGTFTYTSENGTQTIIDVPESVIKEFEKIINNETVRHELEQLILNKGGNVYYDGTKLEYLDENGVKQIIDLSGMIKDNETLTTLINNQNGTYTYTSENGSQTIIEDTLTVLAYNPTTGILTYKDEHKNIATVDIRNAVKTFETVTRITSNTAAGTVTFVDEKGVSTVLDMKAVVKAHETTTKLVNNNNNTFTYYNEKEIDAAGNPIANRGTTFRIPRIETYDMTSMINSGVKTPRDYTYADMTSGGTNGVSHFPNLAFETAFSGTLNADISRPNTSRYLNVNFTIRGHILTISETVSYIGSVEVEALIEVELLINGVVIETFTPKFFRFGGYERGENYWEETFNWPAVIPNNLNIAASNNLEIRLKPSRNTFNKNLGNGQGYFSDDMRVLVLNVSKVMIQLFEK
ncbi:hypothetical protein, partial [Myroides sp. WP-1]|uniref:hypothetical protein n=1 Tax=Myroides sp. WP-1 TaxID=2759944 RepID=UPI0015FDE486